MIRPNRTAVEPLDLTSLDEAEPPESEQKAKYKKAMLGKTLIKTTCNIEQRQWDIMEKKATRQTTKSDLFREALDLYFKHKKWTD